MMRTWFASIKIKIPKQLEEFYEIALDGETYESDSGGFYFSAGVLLRHRPLGTGA